VASTIATWRVLRPVRRFGHPQFHGRCLSGGKRCARCALSLLLRSTAREGQISAVQSTLPVARLLMTEPNTSPPVRLPKPHRALGHGDSAGLVPAGRGADLQDFRETGLQSLARRGQSSTGCPRRRHRQRSDAARLDSQRRRVEPDVLALLRAPPERQDVLQPAANRFLQKLNDHLGGPAIFVLDLDGRVVASSDWIFSDNMLARTSPTCRFFAAR
jgi:hypothetical protein